MQALYSALVALGKSYEDARSGGWNHSLLCDFEDERQPKCANGLLTWNMYGGIDYIGLARARHTDALRLAAVALIKTAPEDVREQIIANFSGDRSIRRLLDPASASLQDLENCLIEINDQHDSDGEPLLTGETASAWFERAFDLLAQELPEPISVLYAPEDLVSEPTLISV